MEEVLRHAGPATVELACLGGIAYLWAARRRAPRPAGLATGALAGVILLTLFDQFVRDEAVDWLAPRTPDRVMIHHIEGALSILSHLGRAACLLTLVAAVAAGRRPAPARR